MRSLISTDLLEWAEALNIPLLSPFPVPADVPSNGRLSAPFPVNSAKSLRGALFAIEQGKVIEYSREIFRAYWVNNRDISNEAVLTDCARAVGLDATQFLDFIKVTTILCFPQQYIRIVSLFSLSMPRHSSRQMYPTSSPERVLGPQLCLWGMSCTLAMTACPYWFEESGLREVNGSMKERMTWSSKAKCDEPLWITHSCWLQL